MSSLSDSLKFRQPSNLHPPYVLTVKWHNFRKDRITSLTFTVTWRSDPTGIAIARPHQTVPIESTQRVIYRRVVPENNLTTPKPNSLPRRQPDVSLWTFKDITAQLWSPLDDRLYSLKMTNTPSNATNPTNNKEGFWNIPIPTCLSYLTQARLTSNLPQATSSFVFSLSIRASPIKPSTWHIGWEPESAQLDRLIKLAWISELQ